MEKCLILTGHVRSFAQCKDSILGKFYDENTDIYVCTWDDQGQYSFEEKFGIPVKKQLILPAAEQYVEKFVPLDRPEDVFRHNERAKNHFEIGWVERLQHQWYCVKRAFELLEDYKKYDIIIRCRFDLKFHDTNFEYDSQKINMPIPTFCTEAKRFDAGCHIYSDHLGWGSPEVMKKYCNFFDYIYTIYEKHNVDIANAEHMLKFYMECFSRAVPAPAVEAQFHPFGYDILKVANDATRI